MKEKEYFGVALEFDAESKALLKRLERDTPRTFRAAHAAAATRAQKRLRKVMRVGGGLYGVPAFAPRHEMTLLLHPNTKPGGMLADKTVIQKGRVGDGQWIGWVDRLTEWASVYQGAGRYPFEDWQRSALHRNNRSLDGYHIPEYYDRPPRMVIDPFSADLAAEFPKMVIEMYEKICARRMKKGQVVA